MKLTEARTSVAVRRQIDDEVSKTLYEVFERSMQRILQARFGFFPWAAVEVDLADEVKRLVRV